MTRFWMVTSKPKKAGQIWCGPRKRHYSHAAAAKEAKRLANLTGGTFGILVLDTVVMPDGVEAEALRDPSDK